eukprot:CAMPEP_0119297390 /NCGR_PEP_ID=MMETSP1329-20130426/51049_1 /TAXON_ID=114041 /ORGANISM="Genus nov. species nov., Strain RCC1024" /LENGTH=72 /DNA_ID=CAMNT_0007298331 /DNA_START=509 /DNA_END=723 /DNA_ORIENTATION=+
MTRALHRLIRAVKLSHGLEVALEPEDRGENHQTDGDAAERFPRVADEKAFHVADRLAVFALRRGLSRFTSAR